MIIYRQLEEAQTVVIKHKRGKVVCTFFYIYDDNQLSVASKRIHGILFFFVNTC